MELTVAKVKKEKNRYFYWLWLISNPIDFAQILASYGTILILLRLTYMTIKGNY